MAKTKQQLIEELAAARSQLAELQRAQTSAHLRASDLALLQAIGKAVVSSLELSHVLSTISQKVTHTLDASWCAIYLWNPATEGLSTLAEYVEVVWAPGAALAYDLQDYPATLRVLQEREPLLVSVGNENDDAAERALLVTMGVHHLLALPLECDNNVIGVIELFKNDVSGQFETAAVEASLHAAQPLGPVVQRMDASKAWKAEIIAHVDKLLVASHADSCTLSLWDKQANSVRAILGHGQFTGAGESGASPTASERKFPQAYSDTLKSQRPQVIRRKRSDLGTNMSAMIEAPDVSAMLLQPLIFDGETIGLLEIAHSAPDYEITERELELADALADQAAIAIQNAHLYELAQEKIVEREQAEAALQAAYEELKVADQTKLESIQNVAHELRTPLGYILGWVGLLLDSDPEVEPLTDSQRQSLETVFRESEKLSWLVENYVVMQTGNKIALDTVTMDIAALLKGVVKSARMNAEQADITLNLEIESDLPQVNINRFSMNQVIDNLLSNALKFTPVGGEIKLRAWYENKLVHVAISDSGGGVPIEAHGKIFDRLYQVKNAPTGNNYGSVGLGLAISKEVVEAHGGEIWLASADGKGAIFTFTLPVAT